MTDDHHDILAISRRLWEWLPAQDDVALSRLFHPDAAFVHMGATFTAAEELDVIRTGRIHYRDIEIAEVSVRVLGATAIVLSTLRLGAVVNGELVSNPFVVTEVYLDVEGSWMLGSLSFTRRIDH